MASVEGHFGHPIGPVAGGNEGSGRVSIGNGGGVQRDRPSVVPQVMRRESRSVVASMSTEDTTGGQQDVVPGVLIPVGRNAEAPTSHADVSRENKDAVSSLPDRVVRAAEGTVKISVGMSSGIATRVGETTITTQDAKIASFGDGVISQNERISPPVFDQIGQEQAYNPPKGQRIMEVVAFEYVMEPLYRRYTEEVKSGGRFSRSIEVPRRERIGEQHTQVTNPETGKPEDAVAVHYMYNTRPEFAGPVAHLPPYVDGYGRDGNSLTVSVTVPKSVADEVHRAITGDPAVDESLQAAADPASVRQLVERAARTRGGLSEDAWNAVRPPWDQLPESWEMHVVTPNPDHAPRDLPYHVRGVRVVTPD